MKTYSECIPCFLRQARDAAKLAGADESVQIEVADSVAEKLPQFSLELSPPEIARTVYDTVDELTGGRDVYKQIKHESNKLAMGLYPKLKKIVEGAEDPLLAAVRLAVAGNVIDYGLPHAFDVEQEIAECAEKDFAVFDYTEFSDAVRSSEKILYILDNAGEIVFDRVLVEELRGKAVCAVREKPIINDVTMDDALEVGLDKVAAIVSSGSDIPGTVVRNCTEEFKMHFNDADLIISKGQGNFETLSDENRPIFFIFKAKCPVVAGHTGCNVGDSILKKQFI